MKHSFFFILLILLVSLRVAGQDRIDWDQIKAAPGANYLPKSNVSGDGVWTTIGAILSGANVVYGTGSANKTAYWLTDSTLSYRNYLAGASRIVTVDAGGNGDYSTISAGITAAAALTPTSSAPVLVLVYPGLYTEGLTITTSYTSLVAFDPGSTTVQNGVNNVLTVNAGLTNVNVIGMNFRQQSSNNSQSLVTLNGATYFYNNVIDGTNCLRTITIANAGCRVIGNTFISTSATTGRGSLACTAAALIQGNAFSSGGSGAVIGSVSAGTFVNNSFAAGQFGDGNNPTTSITGGTFIGMSIFSAGGDAGTIAGGTFYECTFHTAGNNTSAIRLAGSATFYNCSAVQSFDGASHQGYAVRITVAGATGTFRGGRIVHSDIIPNSALPNYAIANTSGSAATINLRGVDVFGLVDFTNLTITGLTSFHADASANPFNRVVRSDRFTSISNNTPAYSLDFGGVTNSGFRLPNVATASLPTGAAGVTLYRTDTATIAWHDGLAWQQGASRAWARSTFATLGSVYSGWTLAGTSGTPQSVGSGQTATIAAGAGLTTTAGATRTVTVAADTASVLATQYDVEQGWLGPRLVAGTVNIDVANATNSDLIIDTLNDIAIRGDGQFALKKLNGSGWFEIESENDSLNILAAGVGIIADSTIRMATKYLQANGVSLWRAAAGSAPYSEAPGTYLWTVDENGQNGAWADAAVIGTWLKPELEAGNPVEITSETYMSITNAGGSSFYADAENVSVSKGLDYESYFYQGKIVTSKTMTGNNPSFILTELIVKSDSADTYPNLVFEKRDEAGAVGATNNSLVGEISFDNSAGIKGIAGENMNAGISAAYLTFYTTDTSDATYTRMTIAKEGDISFNSYDDTRRDSAAHLMAIQEATGKLVPLAQVNAKYMEDSDVTLSAAEVYKFQEVRVWMSTTAGASSQTELTIPDAAAVYLNTKIIVTSKDVNGTYSNLVNTPTATIYEAGSDASSIVVAPGETVVLWGIKTGASSYRWALQKN